MSVIEIPTTTTPNPPIALADGGELVVHPLGAGSEPLLGAFLEALGPEARYRRFHQPLPRVTDAFVRRLCEVDQLDHLAWLLMDGSTPAAEVRAVVSHRDPGTAEVAVAVDGRHHRRGVATRAIRAIATRAAAVGAHTVTAVVQPDNLPSLALMRSLGLTMRLEDGVVECRGVLSS